MDTWTDKDERALIDVIDASINDARLFLINDVAGSGMEETPEMPVEEAADYERMEVERVCDEIEARGPTFQMVMDHIGISY